MRNALEIRPVKPRCWIDAPAAHCRYDTAMAPPAFTELDFDEALERSRANESILIVDAMAAWCGPCRQMDATTWTNADVVARLTAAASFAIQIDVDEEAEIAQQLEIRAMPTLIAFASGIEHDRLVGGRGPKELLEWLDIVERGERFEEAQLAKRARTIERRARATAALATKQYDEALAEYRWLWTEAPDARLVDEMRELAVAHAPARTAFTELRDAIKPADAPLENIFAWITLNQIIGDDDATLAWYATATLPATRVAATLVEMTIAPLLMRCGRWADAGTAVADPRGAFTRMVEAKPADLQERTANLVRALYAAGRDERASDLEYEAESVDASAEMTKALASARESGRADRANRA
jgi:thioredoxin 1